MYSTQTGTQLSQSGGRRHIVKLICVFGVKKWGWCEALNLHFTHKFCECVESNGTHHTDFSLKQQIIGFLFQHSSPPSANYFGCSFGILGFCFCPYSENRARKHTWLQIMEAILMDASHASVNRPDLGLTHAVRFSNPEHWFESKAKDAGWCARHLNTHLFKAKWHRVQTGRVNHGTQCIGAQSAVGSTHTCHPALAVIQCHVHRGRAC